MKTTDIEDALRWAEGTDPHGDGWRCVAGRLARRVEELEGKLRDIDDIVCFDYATMPDPLRAKAHELVNEIVRGVFLPRRRERPDVTNPLEPA
jgi:hypothetical protein